MNTKTENEKIEAIYYLMTDTRRFVEGTAEEDDLRASVREYGKVILERPLTNREVETIMDNA